MNDEMELGCLYIIERVKDMKLLIVDDSNFAQRVISNLVKKFIANVDFYFASDGQEGLDKYKQINPDYVFVDLLMPKINGKKLIELIKQYNSKAKIIVISADVQISIKNDIEKYNVFEFINKPFNDTKAKNLCEMIRNDYGGL